eukprot:sb/3471603/
MMGVIGSGKATLFIPEVTEDHLENYRCVIRDCCKGTNIEIDIEIRVPDETCEDVYGIGHVVFAPVYEYVNWTTAVQTCKDKGMVLAFPKSAEENAVLLADIQKSFGSHPNAKKFAHENWILKKAKVRFKRLDLRFLEIGVYCMLYLLKEILNFQESQVKSFETHFKKSLKIHRHGATNLKN